MRACIEVVYLPGIVIGVIFLCAIVGHIFYALGRKDARHDGDPIK